MSTIVADTACIRQRLWRVLRSSIALEASVIACLERLTVIQVAMDHEDVADVTDRLHEVFNSYSFLTRCNGWHDIDDDGDVT